MADDIKLKEEQDSWAGWKAYVNEYNSTSEYIVDEINNIRDEQEQIKVEIDKMIDQAVIQDGKDFMGLHNYNSNWGEMKLGYVKAPDSIVEVLAKAAPKESRTKRPRYPAYKKDDRVTTPNGAGNVWGVDRDGTVCVELDNDPSILHEFEKKELKKIK